MQTCASDDTGAGLSCPIAAARVYAGASGPVAVKNSMRDIAETVLAPLPHCAGIMYD